MKKLSLVLAAMSVLGAYSFAEDSGLSFTNELGSDLVEITSDGTAFAGLYDKVTVEFASEKVDAMVQASVAFGEDADGKYGFYYDSEEFDWSAAYRPADFLTLALHTGFYVPGSYLVVEDDNVSGGNMGSDGFTAAFTGIEGLTIAASIPFGFDSDMNKFNAFRTVFGACYEADMFSVGGTVKNLGLDDWSAGLYVSLAPVDGLAFYAGYTYGDAEDLYVTGKHVFNLSGSYENDAFNAGFDFNMNDAADMYAGVTAGMGITDAVSASITATVEASAKEFAKGAFTIAPAAAFALGDAGEIEAEVDFNFADGNFDSVTFPVKWTYSF